MLPSYTSDPPAHGDAGWTCAAGETIAYQVTGPATVGSVIGIDYVRGINVTYWAAPSTLGSGGTLSAGQQLQASSSTNDIYTLRLGTDCDLVLTKNGVPTWSTGTASGDIQCSLAMQYDGNLVLYSSTGTVRWFSNTVAFPQASLILGPDGNLAVIRSISRYTLWSTTTGYIANQLYTLQHLTPGDTLYTPDHVFKFVLQGDCNLVVYQGGTAIWNSGTPGQGAGCHADMQGDGNFVLYNSGGTALWNTHNNGQSISRVALQANGKLNLINTNGSTAWTT